MKMLYSRDVFYDGLNCIGHDSNSRRYQQLMDISQSEVSWSSQINYGNFVLYFGTVLLVVFLLKYGWYYLVDGAYESDLITSDFLRNQSIINSSNHLNALNNGSAEKNRIYDSSSTVGPLSHQPIDYSNTTNYNPSIIPKFTALLRSVTYRKISPSMLKKFKVIPNLNFGIYSVLLAITVYLLAYTFGSRPYYRECAGFGSPPLAIRSGVMAMTSFIYIFILSSKTNLVSLITGISYEKLMIYHKYISWCALILSFIHTIPFIYQADREGGYSNWRENYNSQYILYMSGFVSLGALFWLCFMSLSIFRKKSHEIFYHLHWSVALVFLGMLIWHMDNSLNTWRYMWALIVIWFVQLLYRVGFKTALKPNKWFMKTKVAKIDSLDNETFKLEILNSNIHWEAGQHIFIRFKGLRILDNHPFTISSIPSNSSDAIKLIIKSRKGLTGSINKKLLSLTSSSSDPEILSKSLNQSIFIDGPYGKTTRDIYKFDNAVLIANGSGVTFTLPILQKYAQQISNAISINKKTKNLKGRYVQPIIKKVKFIWIIRNTSAIEWIKTELEECFRLGQGLITVDVYICQPINNTESNSTEELISEGKLDFSLPFNIINGKPDMKTLIYDDLRKDLLRRNIFLCSGSEFLTNDVSNGVAAIQKCVWGSKGSCVEDIYLHTESFGY